MRPIGFQRTICKLQAVSSVSTTAPKQMLWIGKIYQPLSVPRIHDICCRNSVEDGHELFRTRMVSHQFAAILKAYGVDGSPVATWQRCVERKRTVGKANGSLRRRKDSPFLRA